MSEVKRYDWVSPGTIGELPDGDYVLIDDYNALREELGNCQRAWGLQRSEIDALRAENERLGQEVENCEQWRNLALQFDRHRMSALVHLKMIVAGQAGAQDACRDFLSAPPVPGHVINEEIDQLRAELAALKAVPDGVVVVAWLFPNPDGTFCMDAVRHDPEYPGAQPVMTVTQHNAIVSSLSPENQHTAPAPPLLADRHPMEVRKPAADEREAFRSIALTHKVEGVGFDLSQLSNGSFIDNETRILYEGWKLGRAALSAPAAGQDVGALVEALPFVHKIIAKLRRFDECASDSGSGGVDIGRHWLDLLTQLGLLIRTQRSPGMWEMSQQGEDALAAHKAGGIHD